MHSIFQQLLRADCSSPTKGLSEQFASAFRISVCWTSTFPHIFTHTHAYLLFSYAAVRLLRTSCTFFTNRILCVVIIWTLLQQAPSAATYTCIQLAHFNALQHTFCCMWHMCHTASLTLHFSSHSPCFCCCCFFVVFRLKIFFSPLHCVYIIRNQLQQLNCKLHATSAKLKTRKIT